MSKKIYIRRKLSFAEEARTDPSVKSYFGMSMKSIGSYFREFGRTIESGLTRDEAKALVPLLTAIYPEDRKEFNASVQDYYKNLSTKIPEEGLELEIGLEDPELPLVYWEIETKNKDGSISTERLTKLKPGVKADLILNHPIKLDDYVRYRHAIMHPQVGRTLDQAEMYEHIKFYIDDPQLTTAIAIEINELEDEAGLIYHNTKTDEAKVTMILTLLGLNTKGKTAKEKVLMLKERSTVDENQTELSQKKALEKFISLATDKKLAKKYEVEEFIRTKILERHGTRILITESGQEIGVDLEDTVGWLFAPENSKDYNIMKAKYKELNKKDLTSSKYSALS